MGMTFRELIEINLSNGYGVEDIAVQYGHPLPSVRREVQKIRDEGRIEQVLGLKKVKRA